MENKLATIVWEQGDGELGRFVNVIQATSKEMTLGDLRWKISAAFYAYLVQIGSHEVTFLDAMQWVVEKLRDDEQVNIFTHLAWHGFTRDGENGRQLIRHNRALKPEQAIASIFKDDEALAAFIREKAESEKEN